MRVDEGKRESSPSRGVQAPLGPEMLLVFRVAELVLGLDVQRVREVTRMMRLSPLPDAGPVTGMILLRGESTVVVDLGTLLRVESGDEGSMSDHDRRRAMLIAVDHGDGAVCLAVDQIDGLRTAVPADVESPPRVVANVGFPWLVSVARSADEELISVVDLDRLLSRVAPESCEREQDGV